MRRKGGRKLKCLIVTVGGLNRGLISAVVVEKVILYLARCCVGKHIDVSQISREGAFVARQDG